MRKIAFYTLGCKVNQYETDAMKAIFEKNQFQIVDFDDFADIYVINTCTVTSMGDKKSRQIIHTAKNNNEDAVVVVTGCMAQGMIRDNKTIEGADIVIGNEDRKNILNIIDKYSGEKIISVREINKEKTFWETEGTVSEDRTRAYIKIQDGCDRYCSYCIIPYVRGPIRSREAKEVISEIEKMANSGFKEVVLIGIHLASYGRDTKKESLIDILEEINEIKGIKRIRLGSLEPSFITVDTVERLGKLNKVCKHFHLSLQSGCDTVLKRMNRRYTICEYEEKVNLLRKHFPDVAITTDVITGFPGETEEEFNETYEFLKRISLSKVHVFPYSKRKGTPAEKMPDQIDKAVKKERADILIEQSKKHEIEFAKKFIGKEVETILEKRTVGEYREGYSEEYVPVLVKDGEAGSIVRGTGVDVSEDGKLVIRHIDISD